MLSHHSANFGHHGNCGSGDIKVLVSHMILQDHAIKNSSSVMGSSHCGGGFSLSYDPASPSDQRVKVNE